MPCLTVMENGMLRKIHFEGTPLISDVLTEGGVKVHRPCGGHGICKKCRVTVEGALSAPAEAEKELPHGVRLSCITRLLGDACVRMDDAQMQQIESDGRMAAFTFDPMDGKVGAAVDIGTTTVAVRLLSLKDGNVLGSKTMENPQRAVASDVIGRMESAMAGKGELLKTLIQNAVDGMIGDLCREHGVEKPDQVVVTGNTTMLYLYTGRDVSCLSRAPFEADCLFGHEENGVKMPECMSAFVGADITCAVLASGMTEKDETSLLIDVGTNGEIALWKEGKLLVSATAAGPAFEGGGIRMGCGSIPGAVDKVWVEDGRICASTISGEKPVGLCGSGIIDAMAALLDTEQVDETGAADEDEMPIAGDVVLTDRDVRAIQLAKGAIAAGIRTLMTEHHVQAGDIAALYLAGGFGAHINLESAVRIGLIPAELRDRTVVLGNAALSGAHMLLLGKSLWHRSADLAKKSRTVNLGGNPAFTEHFMECMLFE